MTRYQIRAYRGTDPFAFVSYAHEDAALVFPEIASLVADGYRIYYDEGIHPGHVWHDDLADAIERCDVFILFVTSRSVVSRYCMRELNFALDKDRQVLAVHLESIALPSGLQLAIGDRQAILRHRFDAGDFRTRLREAMNTYVGAPDQPQATPTQPPAVRNDTPPAPSPQPRRRGRVWGWGAVAAAAVVAGIAWQAIRAGQAEQERLLAEFVAAAEADDGMRAYLLAGQIDEAHRQREAFTEHWDDVSVAAELRVGTPGASVEIMPYLEGDEWIPLGTTPFPGRVTLPRGVVKLRVRKEGFDDGEYTIRVPGPLAAADDPFSAAVVAAPIEISPRGSVADDMVRVPASDMPVWVARWTSRAVGDHRVALPAFEVARREVSNADYQAFVDAGGYRTDGYWQGMRYGTDDAPLTPAQARSRFVDATGQPGPAGWSLGRHPAGEGALPVTGISWYEAVAYARFRGMTLPTMHHWARFAQAPFEGPAPVLPQVAAASNLNQRHALPVTAQRGLGPWGTYDSAGNVREWVWNRVGDSAVAMGGSWADYGTDVSAVLTMDPMSRSTFVGLRLMRSIGPEPLDETLLAPIELAVSEPGGQRSPASDEAFEVMRYQFTADRRRHERVAVETVLETDAWSLEDHLLSYPGNVSARMYVMRPTRQLARYQVVVYGPHGGAFIPGRGRSDLPAIFGHAEIAARTGRLVLMPVWANSMDRFTPSPTDPAAMAARQRQLALDWYQDSVDALNYLDTLPYADRERIAYLAESYGTSVFGSLLMALQPRFKAGIFIGSGLPLRELHPMLDAVHYAPRITQPMLVLNGAFDPVFPPEESQQPLFDLMGTPAADKRMVRYPESGHFRYPEHAIAREIAEWLDRYLGPVQ